MRRTAALAAILFASVLATRLPFAAQTLWAHDSVLYARAIESGFHVDDELRNQRPHPPGYLFYVGSADLAHDAGLDANGALVLVSAVASALAAVGIFLFARRFATDAPALVVAAAYAADPLVWQYSDIAYPYAVLGLGSLVVAIAFHHARGHGLRAAVAASVLFGIVGGFRQDLLVLLGPAWLWCVWPLGPRRAGLAASAVAVACLSWLLPTMALSEGPEAYLNALTSQASYVRDAYSILGQGVPAFVANLVMTVWAAGWALLLAAPLGALGIATLRRDDLRFALAWCVPPLLVYTTLHIGDFGYVLSAVPGLYVFAARGLASLGRPRLVRAAAWTGLVAAPAALFVFTAAPFSAAQIVAHDRELGARFAYVRGHFEPGRTLILTREDFLLVRYYLSDFHARQYDPEPFVRFSRRIRAGQVDHVIVFTPGLSPERAADVRRIACAKGVEFVFFDVQPGAVLEFQGERYAIASPPAP